MGWLGGTVVGWYGGGVVGWWGGMLVRCGGGGGVVGPKDGVREFRVHSFNEREESA